jgi:hypothetical protein
MADDTTKAKQYFASSKILHGTGNGNETVFEPGDKVTGLTKDEMVALWNAGVLTERDPNAMPTDDRDEKIAALEKQLADLKAEQAKAESGEQEGESPDADDKSDEVPPVEESSTKPVVPVKAAPTKATTKAE